MARADHRVQLALLAAAKRKVREHLLDLSVSALDVFHGLCHQIILGAPCSLGCGAAVGRAADAEAEAEAEAEGFCQMRDFRGTSWTRRAAVWRAPLHAAVREIDWWCVWDGFIVEGRVLAAPLSPPLCPVAACSTPVGGCPCT